MNTTELINKLMGRSDGALEQLKLHYGPLIRYVISPILHDECDREEVFNDILIKVWDRIDQYDPQSGSWTNWLSTIAEVQDGWSIDAWINYTHQTPWPQYPVITAKEKQQTMGVGSTQTFKTIQDALQFFPGADNPIHHD